MANVLRPVLWFATFVAVLCAVAQGAGRVLAWTASSFEMPANRLLSGVGVSLHGLDADWRYLNPLLRVDRVEFTGGVIHGVTVELDLAESLWRSRPIARHIEIADATVHFEAGADGGWQVRGMPPGEGFLGRHWRSIADSDHIRAAGRLVFHSSATGAAADAPVALSDPVVLEARVAASGFDSAHRVVVSVGNPDASGAALDIDFAWSGGVSELRPATDSGTWQISGGDLWLPGATPAQGAMRLERLDVRGGYGAGRATGAVALRVADVALPGDRRIGAELAARADIGDGGIGSALVSTLDLTLGSRSLSLPDVHVGVSSDGVRAWLAELEFAPVSEFLGAALAGMPRASQWIDGLAVSGRGFNVNGHVRFSDAAYAYSATVADVGISPFKGVPQIDGAQADVVGHANGVRILVNSDTLDVAFPDLFPSGWRAQDVQGVVSMVFRAPLFGLRGDNLRLTLDGSKVSGGFALSRIDEEIEQRIVLLVNADRLSVPMARTFAPRNLPPDLYDWIQTNVRDGKLADARFGLGGHARRLYGGPFNWIALDTRLSGVSAVYHHAWPEVTDLAGRLEIANRNTRVTVAAARSNGARIDAARVRVPVSGAFAAVSLHGAIETPDALDFVRNSPLIEPMAFVHETWSGDGQIGFDGTLHVPLKPAPADSPQFDDRSLDSRVRADLEFTMDTVDLTLPNYRLAFADLSGPLDYRYPATLTAPELTGRVFDAPLDVAVTTDGVEIVFDMAGTLPVPEVYPLLATRDPGIAEGETAFDARFIVNAGGDQPARLDVRSNLAGVRLDLPRPFGKTPQALSDLETPLARWFGDSPVEQAARNQVAEWLSQVDLDGYATAYGAFARGDETYARPSGRHQLPTAGDHWGWRSEFDP